MSSPKFICLFSSDRSPLYKGDIFRVLALPDGYAIQFRYDRRWVLDSLQSNLATLCGRDAVIFFTTGNDPAVSEANRKLTHVPVRECRIKSVKESEDTGLFVFILELGSFVNCTMDPLVNASILPPTKFATELELEDKQVSKWMDRVAAVESSFTNTLFYRLTLLKGGQVVCPSYDKHNEMSFFSLEEETKYSIRCEAYDQAGGVTELHTESQLQGIYFTNLFETGLGAQKDSRLLPLSTGVLSSGAPVPSFFKFIGRNPKATPDPASAAVSIYWNVSRSGLKAPTFAFLTALTTVGALLTQFSFKIASGQTLTDGGLALELFVRFLGIFLVSFGAGCLYRFFNKT